MHLYTPVSGQTDWLPLIVGRFSAYIYNIDCIGKHMSLGADWAARLLTLLQPIIMVGGKKKTISLRNVKVDIIFEKKTRFEF